MDRAQPTQATENNFFLKLLPPKLYDEARRELKEVHLPIKTVLFKSGETIKTIYFPQNGLVSLVVPLDNGAAVEAKTVGYEGFVGLAAYLDERMTLENAVSQIEGTCRSMPVDPFLELIEKHEPLRKKIHQYAQLTIETVAQSSACNRFHSIEQRCARWLLICVDRVQSNQFDLTQEFLAQMIGVRRPGVTVAATALKEAGLIKYSRGRIQILDRAGLERASCECYRRIRERELRLFGSP